MIITKRTQVVTGILTSLFVLVGGVWGGTAMLDERHVTRTEYEVQSGQLKEMGYTALKKEIRELKESISNAQAAGHTEWARELGNDLQDAIDRLCRDWPSDRECSR